MGRHLAFDAEPSRQHQVRPCPPTFADVFIRGGWRAVESAFGAHTTCNRRWLAECGGDELLRRRRTHVVQVRKLRRAVQHRHELPEPPQPATIELRQAIDFLRSREGGSWLITATGRGDYFFGAIRLGGAEIVDRARRKGFVLRVAAHPLDRP
jgi:hypothetical protein